MLLIDFTYSFLKKIYAYIRPTYIKFVYYITNGKFYGREYWTLRDMADFQDNNKKYWQARGKTYIYEKRRAQIQGGKFVLDVRQEYLKHTVQNFIKDADCILDIGCGFGRNIRFFYEVFGCRDITGIDFSHPMLQNARRYLQGIPAKLICADIRCLPFVDNYFRIIYSYGTLQYIWPEDIAVAISELIRVSRRYVIIQEYPPSPDFKRYKGWDGAYRHDYPVLLETINKTVIVHKVEVGDTLTLILRKNENVK